MQVSYLSLFLDKKKKKGGGGEDHIYLIRLQSGCFHKRENCHKGESV